MGIYEAEILDIKKIKKDEKEFGMVKLGFKDKYCNQTVFVNGEMLEKIFLLGKDVMVTLDINVEKWRIELTEITEA